MSLAVREQEPLAAHTVFHIGGPARFFAEARSREDLLSALTAARRLGLPWLVLGAGSNVLVADRGFHGLVVRPVGGALEVRGSEVYADAALAMARLAAETIRAGLAGLEWAVGVPGTVGGSVRGNAGCFGSEVKDALKAVSVFNVASGEGEEWSAEACEFGYRDSTFKRRTGLVILGATWALQPGSPERGAELVRRFSEERLRTQDIGSPSAGCIFKNVPWARRDVDRERLLGRFPELAAFADRPAIPSGFLIDQAGLKGRAIGEARISERHANFILNAGGATAEAVLMLIGIAKEYVHRRYGLLLEEEIQYVGF